jgi:predicted  nucleic acid-binding Zn-ribbon protein
MARRCTKCRSEFQYTANDALVACLRCGQGFRRVRSRIRRSYSRGRSLAGRVVVDSRRPRTQRRTEPLGRLSHVGLWHDES